MDRRLLLFMLLAMGILWANFAIVNWLNPPQPPKNNLNPNNGQGANNGGPADKTLRLKEPLVAPPVTRTAAKAKREQHPRKWIILGSADADKYRMMAVLNTRGAGVEWVGLNSSKYQDLDGRFNKWGYLGYLALSDVRNPRGAKVNIVCPGMPVAGKLKPGDVIQEISGPRGKRVISDAVDVTKFLEEQSRIGQTVKVKVVRNNKPQTVTIRLGTRPLELIRPETAIGPPLSFLTTLAAVFDAGMPKAKLAKENIQELTKFTGINFKQRNDAAVIDSFAPLPYGWPQGQKSPAEQAALCVGDKIIHLDNIEIAKPSDFTDAISRGTLPTGAYLEVTYERQADVRKTRLHLAPELPGVDLFAANWHVEKQDETQVEFHRTLPAPYNLKFIKRYRLAKVDKDAAKPDYHLTLDVEIINLEDKARKVVYQLDGPQGLPDEAWWYGYKISRNWGGAGARDVVYRLDGSPAMINCSSVANGSDLATIPPNPPGESDPDFVAVDTRYFAAALRPNKPAGPGAKKKPQPWIEFAQPLLVSTVKPEQLTRANVSFRLTSRALDLPPSTADGKVKHSYTVFLGPKESDLLANTQYGLEDLNYYGWPVFSTVAQIMTSILHLFYKVIPNYGIAIILLTVSVRLAMFPLSRKQALGAQKMQQLQPEMKRIAEKYKKNPEQRMKAQRELFRKHNYNPAGGCLLLFVQLPIFIGLYKGLSVDISLRQAPLIEGLYWCSDLSAPDRLFHWAGFMPEFLTSGTSMFSLGPYFNILPICTIVLFLMHQKLFMPPPADEQQAMQHKMMKYMMIFFGFMFFKVPSGLCLYFIASSLWGIAERKLLPKSADSKSPVSAQAKSAAASSSNGSAVAGARRAATPAASGNGAGKKRRRRRRK